ncbi:MAG: hypothetical protein LBQ66_07080 [Planctomycetaceae bacterium]|nr:hypothetical protein [Planctomycetaceae bacterium]
MPVRLQPHGFRLAPPPETAPAQRSVAHLTITAQRSVTHLTITAQRSVGYLTLPTRLGVPF